MRFLSLVTAALALAWSGAAFAQNLSLRAPDWAQPLLASDIIPTTGGRAVLSADGIPTSVRVTIAPNRGGVARVIRYDVRADGAAVLATRRFTGHPSTGWWLWGPDAPRITPLTAAVQQEVTALARSVSGIGGVTTGDSDNCATGEQAYVELAVAGRSTSLSRTCLVQADPVGRLVLRLSDLAGSRNEEELAAASVVELLEADRAFAAAARTDPAAAFTRFAASDAISSLRADWPQGARLERTPETARVSSRGDMGWTYGALVQVGADGARTAGRYVSVWTRDFEGNWRYAFDAAIR